MIVPTSFWNGWRVNNSRQQMISNSPVMLLANEDTLFYVYIALDLIILSILSLDMYNIANY